MYAIEGTWGLDSRLYLWGECSRSLVDFSKKSADLLQYASIKIDDMPEETSALHPRACTFPGLMWAFERLGFEPDCASYREILLPAKEEAPLSTPRLFETEARNGNKLQKWLIPVFVLDPLPALGLLTSLPRTSPSGLVLDQSLLFWVEASKLLLELLTRGQFLPVMLRDQNAYEARWRSVLIEDRDLHRFQLLSQAMPPICSSLATKEGVFHFDPRDRLLAFLHKGADALIRSFLRSCALTPSLEGRLISSRRALAITWLSALNKHDPCVTGVSRDLLEFEQKLTRWRERVQQPRNIEPLRTCFRLTLLEQKQEDEADIFSEPQYEGSEELKWNLEFCLQSIRDEKNVLTAESLWRGDLGFLEGTGHTLEELDEILLRGLGAASSFCHSVRLGLEETHPSCVPMNTAQAYSFLKETHIVLERMGFGVIIPPWWTQDRSGLGLHLDIKSEDLSRSDRDSVSALGLGQLVSYSWKVSVVGNLMTLPEFEALVQNQEPLFKLGSQWVDLDPSVVEPTLDFLRKQDGSSKMSLLEALRIGLAGPQNSRLALPLVGFSANGWVENFLAGGDNIRLDISEVPGFCGELRPYQQQGLSWLFFLSQAGIGGCLADDMGLGKTIQLLALLQLEKTAEDASSRGPALLFAPMSIIDNWRKEAETFTPSLRVHVHHGPTRPTGREFVEVVKDVDLVITTYSLANRDFASLIQVPWSKIVLDEAQNIKNLGSKQTQAIREIGLIRHTSSVEFRPLQRLALTGTPLENHLEELWSILDFLNPDYLGTLGDFKSKYAIPIERYQDKEAASRLASLVSPFILRRLKSDPTIISDLPEKIEMNVTTSLTTEQAILYQSVLDSMIEQIGKTDGMHRKGMVLAMITRLKQICNHPSLYLRDDKPPENRSAKLSRLEEILDVLLSAGDRVLIFTQFAQMGHLLKSYLQERYGKEVLFLHGGVSKKNRVEMIDRFQKALDTQIFVLSLKAGGYGLNLTAANQVIHFDQWWNPAAHEQATDRAHRLGQLQTVQVRRFICAGTLEEKISSLLERKKGLADQIVSSTKSMITEMSTRDLQQLLGLSVISTPETDDRE